MPIQKPGLGDARMLRRICDGNWFVVQQRKRRLVVRRNEQPQAVDAVRTADILGDWREENIWPTTNGQALRVYTTPIPTDRRIYTLMHDPVYRLGIAWQNTAYNQPPHTGFHLGSGMPEPPRPKIESLAISIALSRLS